MGLGDREIHSIKTTHNLNTQIVLKRLQKKNVAENLWVVLCVAMKWALRKFNWATHKTWMSLDSKCSHSVRVCPCMANKERHTEPCGTMAINEGYSKQTNRTALPGLSKKIQPYTSSTTWRTNLRAAVAFYLCISRIFNRFIFTGSGLSSHIVFRFGYLAYVRISRLHIFPALNLHSTTTIPRESIHSNRGHTTEAITKRPTHTDNR